LLLEPRRLVERQTGSMSSAQEHRVMAKRPIFGGDEMVEPRFKRSGDGWIFRAPGWIAPAADGRHPLLRAPWSSRSYLIGDAQKPEVAAIMRHFTRFAMLTLIASLLIAGGVMFGAIALTFTVAPTGSVLRNLSPSAFAVIQSVAMAVLSLATFYLIAGLGTGRLRYAMQAALAGAAETRERITLADQFRKQAETQSVGKTAMYLVFFAVFCAGELYVTITSLPGGSGTAAADWALVLLTGFGVLMFGTFAALSAAMLIVRLRRSRRSPA
jgi:hypothetical protein